MADEYDYLFKSIVVGDGGVGKTALTLRFSKGFFTEDYKMTIGVDFHVKTIKIDTDDGALRCKLQIWDTGGQERFSSIRPMYYRGSLGALLIFDLTSYESFEHLPQWIEEVRANVKSEIPLLLVGNKSDLIDERTVTVDQLNDFTNKFNLYYMETSAKTGDGVGDCFYILACLMIGSGVPEQLVSEETVFAPGKILGGIAAPAPAPAIKVPEIKSEIVPELQPESEFEFAAPPVPEPKPIKRSEPIVTEPEPIIKPELKIAPPVPEPAPAAPSKLDSFAATISEPSIEPEPEPVFEFAAPPVPEPAKKSTDFDFKMPDEIISETAPVEVKDVEYTPKAAPFTSNVPTPAPAPAAFSASSEAKPKEEAPAPFIFEKPGKKETEPAPVTFETPTKPIEISSGSSIPFSAPETSEEASDSLVDYMPETILSKKEQKKLEKQRKKEEKEHAKREAIEAKERAKREAIEAKERAKREAIEAKEQEKLEKERKIQEAKDKAEAEKKAKELAKKEKKEKPKKEKKEKPSKIETIPAPAAPSGSLFQALSDKKEEPEKETSFLPFSASPKTETTEPSKLRIIPNVADIETKPISPAPTPPSEKKSRKKDIIICKQCGAMLSSDYAFCNKCGSKL